jgi:hypothetical protein
MHFTIHWPMALALVIFGLVLIWIVSKLGHGR